MFDCIQCGRPSCKSSSRCSMPKPRNRAQSDDATFAVCAFVLRYQPRMCARQSATAADTNTFFYRARLLPRLVLCTAAYRKKMMHIKGVPRWQADECMWIAHSTSACACDMCIRLRSFPHLSSAFRSSQRLANENRNGSPA